MHPAGAPGARRPSTHEALNATGSTATSAGTILAATFAVVGVTGSSDVIRQLGIGIATGVLLGRWNRWPSSPARHAAPAAGADVEVAAAR